MLRHTLKIVIVLVIGFMTMQSASAGTSAGATIFNQATLTYNGGTQTAAVTVGVALVPSAPVLNDPGNPAVSTTSGADEIITYTITSGANGKDIYNLTAIVAKSCTTDCGDIALPTFSFLSGTSGSTAITSLELEGVITSAASTAGKIFIPAGAETNNLTAGTILSIGGATYVVGTIVPGTVASAGVTEVSTQVPLTPGGPNPGAAIGDGSGGTVLVAPAIQVGETIQFRLVIGSGLLTGGATEGTNTVTITAASNTDGTKLDTDETVITVIPVIVTIVKEVANETNPSCGTPPCFSSSGVETAKTDDILIYRIRISVPASATANLTGAILVDAPPDYTSYEEDTLTVNGVLASTVADASGGTLTSGGDSGVLPLSAASPFSPFSVNSTGATGTGFNLSGDQGVIAIGASTEVQFKVKVL